MNYQDPEILSYIYDSENKVYEFTENYLELGNWDPEIIAYILNIATYYENGYKSVLNLLLSHREIYPIIYDAARVYKFDCHKMETLLYSIPYEDEIIKLIKNETLWDRCVMAITWGDIILGLNAKRLLNFLIYRYPDKILRELIDKGLLIKIIRKRKLGLLQTVLMYPDARNERELTNILKRETQNDPELNQILMEFLGKRGPYEDKEESLMDILAAFFEF